MSERQVAQKAAKWRRAEEAAQTAKQELEDAVKAVCDEGISEYHAAELAGVTRMTVRAWRGK